jgi:hypothetical protein
MDASVQRVQGRDWIQPRRRRGEPRRDEPAVRRTFAVDLEASTGSRAASDPPAEERASEVSAQDEREAGGRIDVLG